MKKRKTPKSHQTILKKVQKGYNLAKLPSNQPTKFFPIVALIDNDELIINTTDFNLTISCAPDNRTKKDLFKNLIKSPV